MQCYFCELSVPQALQRSIQKRHQQTHEAPALLVTTRLPQPIQRCPYFLVLLSSSLYYIISVTMSVIRQNIPNIDWHTLPTSTVVRFFAVQPDVGITDPEVLHRRKAFGANTDHGFANHVSDAYTVRVRRGGTVQPIVVADLVLGDVVVLEQGDRVPAELRLVRARGLTVDESHINGQPIAHKSTHASKGRSSAVHTASIVRTGHAEGVVTAFGHIVSPFCRSTTARLRAHRMRRRGLVVQNPRILQHRLRIRSLVVTAEIALKDIAQMVFEATERGIYIHFVLPQSIHIPPELETFVHIQNSPTDTLRHIRQTEVRYGSCAWITDGTVLPLYRGVAGLSVALASATDIHKLPADILAVGDITDTIRSILHNDTQA